MAHSIFYAHILITVLLVAAGLWMLVRLARGSAVRWPVHAVSLAVALLSGPYLTFAASLSVDVRRVLTSPWSLLWLFASIFAVAAAIRAFSHERSWSTGGVLIASVLNALVLAQMIVWAGFVMLVAGHY